MNEITNQPIVCKNCGSEGVVKYGTYKGIQRYYCKACKRKFKADTNEVNPPKLDQIRPPIVYSEMSS